MRKRPCQKVGKSKPVFQKTRQNWNRPTSHHTQKTCRRCGKEPHSKQRCSAKDVKCHKCAKTGQFVSVYLSSKQIGTVRDYSNGADYAFMDTVEDKTSNKQWLITLHLGNSNVQFRIDTGADETVFPVEVYKELQDVNPLKVPDKKLFGVGETSVLTVMGMFTSVLWGKTRAVTQNIYVVKGVRKSLHDNPAIEALQLNRRVESVEDKTDYQNELSDLFEGPGKMEGSYTITLKEDAQPVAITVPRRLPLPLVAKTKKELKKMEEMEVIMRIEQPTDWCTPMVVVPKKDDVKICIDLTKINKSVLREMPSVEYTLVGRSEIYTSWQERNAPHGTLKH